jgi:hypothetical protein
MRRVVQRQFELDADADGDGPLIVVERAALSR